jgi:hypothetical protein
MLVASLLEATAIRVLASAGTLRLWMLLVLLASPAQPRPRHAAHAADRRPPLRASRSTP